MASISNASETTQWQKRAACRSANPDTLFPNPSDRAAVRNAIKLCASCPVLTPCREAALAAEHGTSKASRHGIAGGLTPAQRWNSDRPKQAEQQTAHCGTTAAYYQHLMSGQPVDPACQAASDRYEQQLTLPPPPPECGTRGGYQKHLREHTAICTPCRQANADADRRLRNTGTTRVAP
ncbi:MULTISPECIES: WhiB family transcriptional regulator [Streptomyces]|uniref:WhiB family transcriptional regulator n=1 Tax=Streptomyces bacillaris TaxID=68179 RepID=A0ABW6DTE0_9ACTN|nr:WhiB family transcriptional regulator [Streptomyces nanshensis]